MKLKIDSLIVWLIVLFPVLDIYLTPIPGVSIGEICLIICSILLILNNCKITQNRAVLRYYMYVFLSTIVALLLGAGQIGSNGIYSLFSYVLYFLLLTFFLNYGKFEPFSEKYIKSAKIISIVSLIQFVLLKAGIKIALLIPFLENDIGSPYSSICASLSSMCGPFTEPAHLAQYLSVALIIVMFRKDINYKYAIFFSVTMLLTFKGNAVVLLGAIWGIRIGSDLLSNNRKMFIRALCIVLLSAIALIWLYNTNYNIRVMVSRIYEISGNGNESLTGYFGVSGYFRIKYGFDFWSSLDGINKLFGIGVGTFDLYDRFSVMPYQIRGLYESNALLNFRSGITTILIDSGIVGIIMYLSAIFKNKSKFQKYIAVVLLIVQCMEATINTPLWLIFMFLVFNYKEVEHKM